MQLYERTISSLSQPSPLPNHQGLSLFAKNQFCGNILQTKYPFQCFSLRILIPNRTFFPWNSPWTTHSGNSDKLHRSHFEKRLINCSVDHLFDIVADVEKYHEFVPYCLSSKVLKREGNTMEAEMVVGFKFLEEKYTSVVTLDWPKSIKVSVLSSKLFHYLTNSWEFEPGSEPDTCWTSFEVSFQFKSEIHRTINDMFFSEVQKRMLFAFENRCKELSHEKLPQASGI